MKINVLSLFDGMSCGQIALERAGIEVNKYYASEIDKNAIKVAKKNYPAMIHIGDVTKWREWDIGPIDLVIGGSPCQSLSIVQSKTRQNLNGKSKLFFEFVDILNEFKPKYFLFENVASMNDESKLAISDLLGCEPVYINSNCFSAQERPRLYWTNIPVDTDTLKECDKTISDIMELEVDESFFYDYPLENVDLNKQVCATMVYKNHDMHKRIFNKDFKCHTLTTCGGGNTQKKIYIKGRARKMTPVEYERLQTVTDNYTISVANTHRYNMLGNGWTVDVIAHIFKSLSTEVEGRTNVFKNFSL